MKKIVLNILTIATIGMAITGCKDDTNKAEINETQEVKEVISESNFEAVTAESMIYWKANKIVGGHEGTISLSKGTAKFKDNALVAGQFIFDIKSLKNTDIPAESEGNAKLVKHLLNEDFFDAEKFPTATFTITEVKANKVSGNLTLKGITKNVTFLANIVVTGNALSITSETFTIDRTQWNITFNSGKFADPAKLGDYMIKDNIEIKIAVKAKKS